MQKEVLWDDGDDGDESDDGDKLSILTNCFRCAKHCANKASCRYYSILSRLELRGGDTIAVLIY